MPPARKSARLIPGDRLRPELRATDEVPPRSEADGLHPRPDALDANDIWAGYDPQKVVEAIERSAGTWSDLDTDAMLERIYRARQEGSRPADRP
jgi:hypothetical protein